MTTCAKQNGGTEGISSICASALFEKIAHESEPVHEEQRCTITITAETNSSTTQQNQTQQEKQQQAEQAENNIQPVHVNPVLYSDGEEKLSDAQDCISPQSTSSPVCLSISIKSSAKFMITLTQQEQGIERLASSSTLTDRNNKENDESINSNFAVKPSIENSQESTSLQRCIVTPLSRSTSSHTPESRDTQTALLDDLFTLSHDSTPASLKATPMHSSTPMCFDSSSDCESLQSDVLVSLQQKERMASIKKSSAEKKTRSIKKRRKSSTLSNKHISWASSLWQSILHKSFPLSVKKSHQSAEFSSSSSSIRPLRRRVARSDDGDHDGEDDDQKSLDYNRIATPESHQVRLSSNKRRKTSQFSEENGNDDNQLCCASVASSMRKEDEDFFHLNSPQKAYNCCDKSNIFSDDSAAERTDDEFNEFEFQKSYNEFNSAEIEEEDEEEEDCSFDDCSSSSSFQDLLSTTLSKNASLNNHYSHNNNSKAQYSRNRCLLLLKSDFSSPPSHISPLTNPSHSRGSQRHTKSLTANTRSSSQTEAMKNSFLTPPQTQLLGARMASSPEHNFSRPPLLPIMRLPIKRVPVASRSKRLSSFEEEEDTENTETDSDATEEGTEDEEPDEEYTSRSMSLLLDERATVRAARSAQGATPRRLSIQAFLDSVETDKLTFAAPPSLLNDGSSLNGSLVSHQSMQPVTKNDSWIVLTLPAGHATPGMTEPEASHSVLENAGVITPRSVMFADTEQSENQQCHRVMFNPTEEDQSLLLSSGSLSVRDAQKETARRLCATASAVTTASMLTTGTTRQTQTPNHGQEDEEEHQCDEEDENNSKKQQREETGQKTDSKRDAEVDSTMDSCITARRADASLPYSRNLSVTCQHSPTQTFPSLHKILSEQCNRNSGKSLPMNEDFSFVEPTCDAMPNCGHAFCDFCPVSLWQLCPFATDKPFAVPFYLSLNPCTPMISLAQFPSFQRKLRMIRFRRVQKETQRAEGVKTPSVVSVVSPLNLPRCYSASTQPADSR
eukprot:GDKJ01015889.1.p1 GENE.GDKJ01015889.1~~GDKJ01015889.1.p1  ORF type:complete len:1068 (-),score=287.26 GDKJ01015889.1:334-3375(-)